MGRSSQGSALGISSSTVSAAAGLSPRHERRDIRSGWPSQVHSKRPTLVEGRPLVLGVSQSLDRDAGAGSLKLLLRLGCGFLGDLLQNRLRGRLDKILCLLEAEIRESAHLLDDADLLLAGALEDDVELRLLLDLLGGSGRGSGGRNGNRSSGGHAERVFELLHELAELDQCHPLEGLKELVIAELGHGGFLPYSVAALAASVVSAAAAA